MVKTLVQIVRCKHALGALLIHTKWKLARQKGQPSVPGAGEDGAICLFVKRLLSFYEKWEMWAVWLSQLLLPQRRNAFLLWPSAAQILVPLWYLCLACSSQPLIYIPYEFQRFGGSASRSCRTEGFQNTLPIWKPRAALGIFCVQTTWKARFLGPFIWVIYHIFKLQTDAPLSRLQLLTRPQITQSCTFNCKITKSTTLKKKRSRFNKAETITKLCRVWDGVSPSFDKMLAGGLVQTRVQFHNRSVFTVDLKTEIFYRICKVMDRICIQKLV